MSFHTSMQATRLLDKQLALDRYKQQLERQKLTQELDSINQARRLAIQKELDSAKREYEEKLLFEKELAADVQSRQRRAEQERRGVLVRDLKVEQERLTDENRRAGKLDGEYAVLEEKLARLKANSKISYEQERVTLAKLQARQAEVLELANQSRLRQDTLVTKLEQLRLRL